MLTIDWWQPFQYEFFRNAIVASTVIGGMCGLIGVFVVLRRMSYIGHGLSHSIFGGAVFSYVMNWNFYLGAGIWGFLSAVIINLMARRHRIGADAAIGIVTTASFAFGVALVSRQRSFTRNFEAALFGNVLGVTQRDLLVIGGTAIVVAGAILVAYRYLVFAVFDPELAQVYGVRTTLIETGFSLVLAMTVVVSVNIVGVTLIAASIVIPASTARLVMHSFGKVLVLSTILGTVYGFAGMYLSFQLDIASGAAIVLLEAAGFVLVFAATYPYRLQRLQRTGVRAEPTPADRSPFPVRH
jgi:manganese/iron transport system permease protein/iron/zinc/copper transport system permease protein